MEIENLRSLQNVARSLKECSTTLSQLYIDDFSVLTSDQLSRLRSIQSDLSKLSYDVVTLLLKTI